jgi:hypothetical protein
MQVTTIEKFYETAERLVRDEVRMTGAASSRVFAYGENEEDSVLVSTDIPDKDISSPILFLKQVLKTKEAVEALTISILKDGFIPMAYVHVENVVAQIDGKLMVSHIGKNDDGEFDVIVSKAYHVLQSVEENGFNGKLELIEQD